MVTKTNKISNDAVAKKKSLRTEIWKNRYLYALLAPGMICLILFRYFPIAWLTIAFKDYKLLKGMDGSEWVGFKHFIEFFQSTDCFMIIKNTFVLSAYGILFDFPATILFALMLNEIRNIHFKKAVQTITYLPHFISTVVLVGLVNTMLTSVPPGAVFKVLSGIFGMEGAILGKEQYFRPIYVISSIWQQTGWSAIVYIAALAGIDPTYYEAAVIDGAGRIKQLIHITIPCIMGTIVLMLILKIGNILSIGFEKAFLMQTDTTRQVSEIISTYVYKKGLANKNYSYATAVGLFNSVIGFALVVSANKFSKKVSEYGLW